jgi:cell division protein FtsB
MAKTGKIFKDSSNIYQDEAKILFNYYQQCAEKIVSEEERLEKEIDDLNADKAEVEERMTGLWNIILNFILFRTGRLKRQLAAIEEKISSLNDEHNNLFRDYKVTKLGVAYVPVADQIKYEDKSFIVDYAGNVDNSKITLQMPRQSKLLGSTIQEVVKLAS